MDGSACTTFNYLKKKTKFNRLSILKTFFLKMKEIKARKGM